MASDSGQTGFRRGVMSLVILSLLRRQDMYGYQLVQETERSSGGKLSTQEGSLYPVLYKLLDQGYISDRKVLVGKRMTRVYYHLEPKGEEKRKELAREYEEVTQGVFQIMKESDSHGNYNACSVVSGTGLVEDTGQLEAEEENSCLHGIPCPGLC